MFPSDKIGNQNFQNFHCPSDSKHFSIPVVDTPYSKSSFESPGPNVEESPTGDRDYKATTTAAAGLLLINQTQYWREACQDIRPIRILDSLSLSVSNE